MPISVPHFSQEAEELRLELSEIEADFWSQNACGIICTRMAITALTGNRIPLRELLAFSEGRYDFIDFTKTGENKSLPIFSEKGGWLNYALIKKIAAKYNVFGRWYFEDTEAETLYRITTELEKNNIVAVSVRADFDHTRGPHLIIITDIDIEKKQFIINDPLRTQESEVSFGVFFSVFSGRFLIFSSEDLEVFRVMNPIYIEANFRHPELVSGSSRSTQILDAEINSAGHKPKSAIIHVHGNEIPAHDQGKSFAQSNHLSFLSLAQSGERFLRLPTGIPEKMTPTTKFARIDANRIYSSAGLDMTISTLNRGHMSDENHILDIKLKGEKIAKAFLSELEIYDAWIAVHNNFSNEYEYSKYGNFFGMKTIPPLTSFLSIFDYTEKAIDFHIGNTLAKNAFVLVNTLSDFELLKQSDINVVLICGHDEIGSLGEAADNLKKRYFCIETGYEDEYARQKIMEIISQNL